MNKHNTTPYNVKPLPYEFCEGCGLNGNYPWNTNPTLLCRAMGGLFPNVIFTFDDGKIECESYLTIDEDYWQNYLSGLIAEATWNEELRKKARTCTIKSDKLLPAEQVEARSKWKG